VIHLANELKTVVQTLNENNVDYALCGGLALAVYSIPRATVDIDVMILSDSEDEVLSLATELGFTIDAGTMYFANDTVRIHRVTKIDPDSGDTLPLDLIFATPEMTEVWETRRQVEWSGLEMTVVSRDGLILMKSMRGNGQDKDEVERLRETDED